MLPLPSFVRSYFGPTAVVGSFVVGSLVSTTPCRAQDLPPQEQVAPEPSASGDAPAPSPEKARADALFQSGRELLRQGKVADACKLLEASQRLDPAGGTLLNLSRCYEGLGRFASADAVLERALALATARGRDDAVAFVEGERSRLAPRVDRVVVSAPSLPPHAGVELDGRRLSAKQLASPIPIDPGSHAIVVDATGYVSFRKLFQLEADPATSGRVIDIRVPALTRKAKPAAPAAPPDASGSWMSGVGWSSMAAGGVALGVGAALGVAAIVTYNDAARRCPARDCSDRDAVDDIDRALTMSGASTGLMIAGALLGGGGLVLVVAAPDPRPGSAARAEIGLRGTLP